MVVTLERREMMAVTPVGSDVSFGSGRFPSWGDVDVRADGSGVAVTANVLTNGFPQDVVASIFDTSGRVTRTLQVSPTNVEGRRFVEPRVAVASDRSFVVTMNTVGEPTQTGIVRFYDASGALRSTVSMSMAVRGVDVGTGGRVVVVGIDAPGDVRARRFGLTGNQLGSQRIDVPGAGAVGATVGVDSTGKYWLAWGELDQATAQVRARMFESTGSARGGLLGFKPSANQALVNPLIATSRTGEAVLAMARSSASSGTFASDIVGQRLSNSGRTTGSLFNVVTQITDTNFDLAMNASGQFVVGYRSGNRAFVRAYSPAAVLLGVAQANDNSRNTSTRQIAGSGGVGIGDRSITAGFFTWSYPDSTRTLANRGQAFVRRLTF